MQIVIDISDEQYEIIKKIVKNQNNVCPDTDSAEKIILNGAPLPKGHGRLIDKDALGEKLNKYSEAPYQYALRVFNESPIIIETDKGRK